MSSVSDPRAVQLRSEVGPWTTALGGLGDTLHQANPVEDLERLKGKLENISPMNNSKMLPGDLQGAAGGGGNGGGSNSSELVGGAAKIFAMSDERLKMNIRRMATDAIPGVPWAEWEYRDAPGVLCRGVIAQDMEKVAPQWVAYRADGMRMVNYAFLLE